MKLHQKQCFVCGFTANNRQYKYYDFSEVLKNYRVGYVDICGRCGQKADSFINYYGKKKESDLKRLHKFLVSGVLPMRDFSKLMNAGYF
jgi:hypothetical protein